MSEHSNEGFGSVERTADNWDDDLDLQASRTARIIRLQSENKALATENAKLKEQNEALRKGAQFVTIINAQTIAEQESELKRLRERVAKSEKHWA